MNRKIFVTGATSGIGLEFVPVRSPRMAIIGITCWSSADRLAAIKEDFEQQYGVRVIRSFSM